MSDYSRRGSGNSGGGYGNNSRSYNDDRGGRDNSRGYNDDRGGRPEMHSATCAKCNSRCEVPFKPNGRKPIYCSDCFERDQGGSRDHDRSRSYDRPRPHSRPPQQSTGSSDNKEVVKQLKTIGIKMDKMIQLLAGLSDAMMEGIEDVDAELEDEEIEIIEEIEEDIEKAVEEDSEVEEEDLKVDEKEDSDSDSKE